MADDGAVSQAVHRQPSTGSDQPTASTSGRAPLPAVQPHVSVIVVNWNTGPLLRQCLRSIVDEPGAYLVSGIDSGTERELAMTAPTFSQHGLWAEVIVVDNASSDGSVAMMQEEFPQAQLIVNEQNVGFAAANNQAIQLARGRLLFLLNPDAFVCPGALSELTRFMAAHPEAAAVAPNVLNPDGTWQATAFRFPTLWDLFCEAVFLSVLWPRSSVFARRNLGGFQRDRVRAVDWVQGCAMMVRRSVWDAVGPFDEGYWMYAEELDWFRRAHGLGYRVFFSPDAEVVHYGKRAVARAKVRVLPLGFRSQFRYFRKFDGAGVELAVRTITLLQMGLRAAISAGMMMASQGDERERWRENWRAYTAVLREALNLF